MARPHKRSTSVRRAILERRRDKRADEFTDKFLSALQRKAARSVQLEDGPQVDLSKIDREAVYRAVRTAITVGETKALQSYLQKAGSGRTETQRALSER